jgi:glutamate-ammonia-ligase adenylyltransferase
MLFSDVKLSPEDAIAKAGSISSHLGRLFDLYADDLPTILKKDFQVVMDDADKALIEGISSAKDDATLMTVIRQYRGRVNHMIAVTDHLDLDDVDIHMKWLSHASELALSHLADKLAGEDRDKWFMLGLGKMGAGELNYSSDIDLIIITLVESDDHDRAQNFIKLTRRLVNIMSTPTKDGIGWRVDLRLRPDPGATPVAIQHGAAMSYYESLARTWERAAFIRARTVAGNIERGEAFLNDLSPFVWRRYLDYTVLDDLKIMLRREPREDHLLGYSIKNGYGGIRSIEFFVHAQQLIAGGREDNLRLRSTVDALDALAKNEWITPEVAENLKAAYKILRRIEHRLQMIGDVQTHAMPKSDEAFADFARFCGTEDSETFKKLVIELGDNVHRDTIPLLERLEGEQQAKDPSRDPSKDRPEEPSPDDIFVLGEETPTASVEALKKFGYQSPETITLAIQAWLAGRVASTRSTRARDILTNLLPRLLAKLAETGDPDTNFAAFARLVENLPAGLQLFSLMDTHPQVAEMVLNIVTSAPKLADLMSSHPTLADDLLYQSFWLPEDDWPAREEELMSAIDKTEHYEEKLLILRRFCHQWKFRTSAQLLQDQISSTRAGEDYTAIADIMIRMAITVVGDNIESKLGVIKDGSFAVMAMGRLGAQEMTLQSDLDLVFIYDGSQDEESAAPSGSKNKKIKSVYSNQYFSRFGQELIIALSSPTSEGRCYEIDMRLRPSGNQGPVAAHFNSFMKYESDEAWTWEHMALIKSRVVGYYGKSDLKEKLEKNIPGLIRKDTSGGNLLEDVAVMRERLKAAHPRQSELDIKTFEGGIMDVDFLVEIMQMVPKAHKLPLKRRTLEAAESLAAESLFTKKEADAIADAFATYTEAIQLMRLLDMSAKDEFTAEDELPSLLKKRFSLKTYGEFVALLKKTSEPISQMIEKYVSKAGKKKSGAKV